MQAGCLAFSLAQNPDVRAKIRKEVDDAKVSGSPTFETLKKLPYTFAVLKESLRCVLGGLHTSCNVLCMPARPRYVETHNRVCCSILNISGVVDHSFKQICRYHSAARAHTET
jgi:hypothetical protein